MFTTKRGSKLLWQLIEVFVQMYPTSPLAWTPWGTRARWNDAGYHMAGPGDFDLVGVAGLNGSHELRQIGLGIMHVDPHSNAF